MLNENLLALFKEHLAELFASDDFDANLDKLGELAERFQKEYPSDAEGYGSILATMALTYLVARYDAIWSLLVNRMADGTDDPTDFTNRLIAVRGLFGKELVDAASAAEATDDATIH